MNPKPDTHPNPKPTLTLNPTLKEQESTFFTIDDIKKVPLAYQEHYSDFLQLVLALSSDKQDPTKLFSSFYGGMKMKCSLLTTEWNKSGILWSSYQKTVYLPYFCSKVQNQGLGTELLRQIEKMFIATNYTSMVVFSTPNQIQFYSERGFASLTQPKLIGSSVKGQKFVKQLSEISFPKYFWERCCAVV